MNTQNPWVVAVVVAIAFGAGGYFIGKQSSSSSAMPSGPAAFARRTGGAGRFGDGTASGFTAGTILSVGPDSMTIQLMQWTNSAASSGTKIVLFDTNTQVSEMQSVRPTSLSAGQTIVVAGSQNADGSMIAATIQVRPAGGTGVGPTSPPPDYNK